MLKNPKEKILEYFVKIIIFVPIKSINFLENKETFEIFIIITLQ